MHIDGKLLLVSVPAYGELPAFVLVDDADWECTRVAQLLPGHYANALAIIAVRCGDPARNFVLNRDVFFYAILVVEGQNGLPSAEKTKLTS